MEGFRKTTGRLSEEVTATRSTLKATLRQQAQNAGGSSNWLAGNCPRLASGSPQGFTETELLAENIDGYRDAENRLVLCAKCPETGGGCANEFSVVPVGERPVWRDRRLVSEPCPKWAEFKTRRRLKNSDVPEFYWDSSFFAYGQPKNSARLAEVMKFSQAIAEGRREFLVLSGPAGSGKTRLAVALLRALVQKVPRALLWYADVTTVRSQMKLRYDGDDESQGDPFGHARESHVLVVDNVDPAKYAKEPWVADRVGALLRERWLGRRVTVVCTHERFADLEKAYGDIPQFSETRRCQLS